MDIPNELKDLHQWVHWRHEEKDGRKTKVPVQMDGSYASSTNGETWTAYPEEQPHDGVGIVFANGLAGIDLDNAIEGNKLKPWAQKIVDHFQTYTEVSPSGNGVHLLFKTNHDFDGKKKYINEEKHEAIECYKKGRYFTVTGKSTPKFKTLQTIEPRKMQEWLLETFPPKPEPKSVPSPITRSTLPDDDTILNKIRLSRNGKKFQMLFDQGDWDQLGFASQSEADLSLAGTLMFFCCNDALVVDRLFRRSQLYREKWDTKHGKDTYGNQTIMKAQRAEVMNWLDPNGDDPQDLIANAVMGEIRVEKTSIGFLAKTPVHDGEAHFRFSNLSVSRDGIKALVTTHIHRFQGEDSSPFSMRTDLSSMSAQSSLTTQYNNAFGNKKDGYNWGLTINNVFTTLLERLTQETRSVNVLGHTYEEPDFLVHPFLQKDATNMIFAQGETGKTFWAMYLGVSLISGKDFFGFPSEKNHKVLFVDYEDNLQVFTSRLHRVCQGLGVPYEDIAKNFRYLNPMGSVKDNLEVMRQDIIENNISLAIFDAGGDACGGSPNDERLVIELFNSLQLLPTTKLVIHHEPKNTLGVTNEQAAYGSAYWRNRTRVAWRLQKHSEDESGKIVKMSIAKKSNLGYIEPIFYRFEFETQADAAFENRSVPGVYFKVIKEPEKLDTSEQYIIEFLIHNGACTLKEICDGTDIPRATVQRTLEEMIERHGILREGGGKGRGNNATYQLRQGEN